MRSHSLQKKTAFCGGEQTHHDLTIMLPPLAVLSSTQLPQPTNSTGFFKLVGAGAKQMQCAFVATQQLAAPESRGTPGMKPSLALPLPPDPSVLWSSTQACNRARSAFSRVFPAGACSVFPTRGFSSRGADNFFSRLRPLLHPHCTRTTLHARQ